MNSGAFGSEFKDILIDVKAVNSNGELKIFSNEELDMGYRKISIDNKWIFIEARFRSYEGVKANIIKKMREVINLRKAAQPIGVKTGGSTFKNPINQKAWQLIEQAGCRGLKNGDAMISEKHCNFIVNLKSSNAQQIEELGEIIHKRVFQTSGISLSWELQRVGIK